ncbi:hypothetical protein [Azospirillum largimobile]
MRGVTAPGAPSPSLPRVAGEGAGLLAAWFQSRSGGSPLSREAGEG